MQKQRGSGPDVRLYLPSADDSPNSATVLDVTCVALMTASHSGKPATEFAARESSKVAKYGEMCTAAKTQLVVGTFSENGTLSRQFGSLVDSVARRSGMPAHEARKTMQAAIQQSFGRSVANAERRAGLAYVHHGVRPVSTTASLTALDPDSTGIAGAPWLAPPATPTPSPTPSPTTTTAPTPTTVPSTDSSSAPPAPATSPPPSVSAAPADGASAEPDPTPPTEQVRRPRLQFGKSPVMAHPEQVYTGCPVESKARAFDFIQRNPMASTILNTMRQGYAGQYVSSFLIQKAAPRAMICSAEDLFNLRAICALLGFTDQRGIIIDDDENVKSAAVARSQTLAPIVNNNMPSLQNAAAAESRPSLD
jgi:hypothetical protein